MECRLFSRVSEFHAAYPENKIAKCLVEGHAQSVKEFEEVIDKLRSAGEIILKDARTSGHSVSCNRDTKIYTFAGQKYMEFTRAEIPEVRVFMAGKKFGSDFVFE